MYKKILEIDISAHITVREVEEREFLVVTADGDRVVTADQDPVICRRT